MADEEQLSKDQAEASAILDDMKSNMMRVDGCMDIENAERLIPDAQRKYEHYSVAALNAFQEYKKLDNPTIHLRDFISNKMAQADGFNDRGAAIRSDPELKDVYERYSFAASFTLYRYERKVET